MLAKLNFFRPSAARFISSVPTALSNYLQTLEQINQDPNRFAKSFKSQLQNIYDNADINFYDSLVLENISFKHFNNCRINGSSALVSTTPNIISLLATTIHIRDKGQRTIPYAALTPLGMIQFLEVRHPDRICARTNPESFAALEKAFMDAHGFFRQNCGEYNLYITKALTTSADQYVIPRTIILNQATPEILEIYNTALKNIDKCNEMFSKSDEWER